MKRGLLTIVAAGMLAGTSCADATPISTVSYSSLTGTELITFDDVSGGTAPGTSYDEIFISGGVGFAERFVGQVNVSAGAFDALSGAPGEPLRLAAGPAAQNLNIFSYGTNVLTGLGPLGFPAYGAIGEGAFALLFTSDQSEFGLQLLGGNNGSATLNFFRRNGSLIGELEISNLSDQYYGFRRERGLRDIAGISIFNNDDGGLAFDNLRHDVVSGSSQQEIPEPGTFILLGIGLAGFGRSWQSRRKRKQVEPDRDANKTGKLSS